MITLPPWNTRMSMLPPLERLLEHAKECASPTGARFRALLLEDSLSSETPHWCARMSTRQLLEHANEDTSSKNAHTKCIYATG